MNFQNRIWRPDLLIPLNLSLKHALIGAPSPKHKTEQREPHEGGGVSLAKNLKHLNLYTTWKLWSPMFVTNKKILAGSTCIGTMIKYEKWKAGESEFELSRR